MRAFLSFLVFGLLAVMVLASTEVQFQEWGLKHGKVYHSKAEFDMRAQNFERNVKQIRFLNSLGSSAKYALNEFADMSQKEFRNKRLMSLGDASPLPMEHRTSVEIPHDLPTEWDWRQKGAVTPVKDQGSVGSCWAFSTTGNIEGQLSLQRQTLVPLSEEQLVDCDYNDCGVFGGWPYKAMEYIMQAKGLQSEADYPYCSGTGECFPCMANKNRTFCGPPPSYCARNCSVDASKPRYAISNWQGFPQDEAQIAAALVQRGPLSILMNAAMLQFYHEGVYDPPEWMCPPGDLDHAVLLVGYGTESSLTGKKDFWIVKNSPKWGESGYFRIKRGVNRCGVNSQAITAVL